MLRGTRPSPILIGKNTRCTQMSWIDRGINLQIRSEARAYPSNPAILRERLKPLSFPHVDKGIGDGIP
jgi:hypothetical protein